MSILRSNNEPPEAIVKWGWKYHHTGVPTDKIMDGEIYLPQFKLYVSGFSSSPFGIEWMRYEKDCPLHELIKTVPHLAFEVDDIDRELSEHGFNIIYAPGSPSEGVRSGMIEYKGAPVELVEFRRDK